MNFKKVRVGIFIALTASLMNACGGGTTTQKSVQLPSDHPIFSRSNITSSPSYAPSGDITEQIPTFSWGAIENATRYSIGHESPTDESQWYDYEFTASEAGCDTGDERCRYTHTEYSFTIDEEKVWWVRAMVNSKWQAWSKSIVFTVVDEIVDLNIEAPVLIAPSGTMNTLNLEFSWNHVSNAIEYKIGYEAHTTVDSWTEIIVSAADASCALGGTCIKQVSPLFAGNDTSWWIKAKNSAGDWSDWSARLDFIIDTSVQQIPDQAYDALCLGIYQPSPAKGNFLDGVLYNEKRIYLDPSDHKRLMISDKNGNNIQKISSYDFVPSFLHTNGALFYQVTEIMGPRSGTLLYRLQSDHTPVHLGGRIPGYRSSSSTDHHSYSNSLDIFMQTRSGPSHSSKALMVENKEANTSETLILDKKGVSPRYNFNTYYLDGIVYYFHQEDNQEKVTGYVNASGKLTPVGKCL